MAPKMFLEILQNSQENTSAWVSFLMKLQAETCCYIKKEFSAQVSSCESCKISKNTFFIEHPWATASEGLYHFWKHNDSFYLLFDAVL